jgi:two-component system, sensor histidine kinase and response regulator
MKSRILLIDDELYFQENLKEILTFHGFEVVSVDNGRDALELLSSKRFDLIISDISMPEMDGFELLSSIKNIPGLENTPFIFLTAKIAKEDLRLGMDEGADDYLVKPVSSKVLLRSISSNLDKRNKREEWVKGLLESSLNEDRKITFHEFRTPLSGLFSIFEIMESSINVFDKNEFIELIELGKLSLERMKDNLNKLSIYYQLNHLKPVISKFVYDIETFKRSLPQEWNNVVIQNWDHDVLINFDAGLFDFIVKELLNNAYKFSDPNSSIYINFTPDFFEVSNYQTNVNKIGDFSPIAFCQINRGYFEQQGLGLGLYISDKICLLNNALLSCKVKSDLLFTVSIAFKNY